MNIWSCSPARTHSESMYRTPSVLITICDSSRNVDSVHHFSQRSSTLLHFRHRHGFVLFEINYFEVPIYLLDSGFSCKASACAYILRSVITSRLSHFDFCNRGFQLIKSKIRLPSLVTIFLLLNHQKLGHWFQQTPPAKLAFLMISTQTIKIVHCISRELGMWSWGFRYNQQFLSDDWSLYEYSI